MNAPFEREYTSTLTPEQGALYPKNSTTTPAETTETTENPTIERGYDRAQDQTSAQVQPSLPRPELIDLTYLNDQDRQEFEELRQRARTSETAHYRELMDSLSDMGNQAVMSSILAGDISQHRLIAVNYAKRVGVLGSTLSLDHQDELTEKAVQALGEVPTKVEVDEVLKRDAQNAQDILRAKESELQRRDEELAALRDYLKEERDKLLPQWAMMSEDDPERAFLDAKIKKLGTLISPSLDTTFTKRMPTTAELEESLTRLTPEDASPAHGLTISHIAEKALGGVLGLFSK